MKLPVITIPNGYTLYTGKSPFNGDNIAVIAIINSDNRKTGNMIQIYIINVDVNPITASINGQDNSVCGDCRHRGINGKSRTCYVNLATGTDMVYRGFISGKYPTIDKSNYRRVFNNRFVRFGAYGDPTLIPIDIVEAISSVCIGWTGYTHQWERCNEGYRGYFMASVDNRKEYGKAKRSGWRTFRIRKSTDKIYQREFVCPASDEGNNRMQCINCNACNGTKRNTLSNNAGSVTIIVHGKNAKKFAIT